MDSPMRQIRIEKLTLNIGAGKEQSNLDKGMVLIKNITGISPVKTITQKRIANWGLRPGLPIGCKLTFRRAPAAELLKRLLAAKSNVLSKNNFDNNGNISFGIHEYIDIPDVKYDPKIGILGLQASLTLQRPGFRIKRRKIMKRRIPRHHIISQEEAINFLKDNFKIKIEEEEAKQE
ncbi:50S ribosomal protein L5 [Candidatus Woesearchaeota archaeon]|nr:50S ribosomal protein L5 [Candidatus Woesearchaeota archaeon]